MTETENTSSLDYSAKVGLIRQMPRRTPEQRQAVKTMAAETREAIRQDRFAVSFAYPLLESALIQNPQLTSRQTLAIVEGGLPDEAKNIALRILESLKADAKRSAVVLGHFVKEVDPGKEFFKVYAGKEPMGSCGLYDEPFGIYLAIGDEKDFRVLDPQKNVGGFYRHDARIEINRAEVSFPLIVTQGLPTQKDVGQRVLPHERGHGYVEAQKTGLMMASVDLHRQLPSVKVDLVEKFWGGGLEDSEEMKKKLAGIIGLAKTAESLNRYPVIRLWGRVVEGWARGNFSIWANNLRHQALGEAKNEILVTLYAPAGDLDQKASDLKKQNFIYDYLSAAGLSAAEDTLLHDDALKFRDNYNAEIDRATAVAKKVVSFLSGLGFEDNREMSYGLLIPDPVEHWPIFYHKNFPPEKIAADNSFAGKQLEDNLAQISGRLRLSFEQHRGEILAQDLIAEEINLRKAIARTTRFIPQIAQEEKHFQILKKAR